MTDRLVLQDVRQSGRLLALARRFATEAGAHALLGRLDIPVVNCFVFKKPLDFWEETCAQIANGEFGAARLQALFGATLFLDPDDRVLYPGPPVPAWMLPPHEPVGDGELRALLDGRVHLDDFRASRPVGEAFARLEWQWRLIDALARALRGHGQRPDTRVDDCYRAVRAPTRRQRPLGAGERPTAIDYAWELSEHDDPLLLVFVRQLRDVFPECRRDLERWEDGALHWLSKLWKHPVCKPDEAPAGGAAWLSVVVRHSDDNAAAFVVKGWLYAGAEVTPLLDGEALPATEQELPDVIAQLRADAADVCAAELHVELFLPRALLCHAADQWMIRLGTAGRPAPIGYSHPFVVRSLELWGNGDARKAVERRWNHAVAQAARPDVVTALPERKHAAYLLEQPAISDDGEFDLRESDGVVCVLLGCPVGGEAAGVFQTILDAGVPAIVWLRCPPHGCSHSETLAAFLSDGPLPELPRIVWQTRKQYRPSHPDNHPSKNVGLLFENPTRVPPDLMGRRGRAPGRRAP